jgi:hypothetical protein
LLLGNAVNSATVSKDLPGVYQYDFTAWINALHDFLGNLIVWVIK